eukprot:CAMPEP_0195137072 /NCGR_PEP_ID=MMETSP0448-20130528/155299_1 /TAXON_ID=66468 /ORGANISM="Heterocapsa triquestra, Strain CCMP 448" /LENGTH=78 /DNA_ID=CAMNT_0040175283 /DNA_START=93 /DNA_END=326 /DNA_ORIENTATION=+
MVLIGTACHIEPAALAFSTARGGTEAAEGAGGGRDRCRPAAARPAEGAPTSWRDSAAMRRAAGLEASSPAPAAACAKS